mmetsp:Transcript_122661/g.244009  ORF Transcript_122661/g.244009 Transcript_122661/m.244009 type:complete len:124 (-) Transcript_122661:240-611(-)
MCRSMFHAEVNPALLSKRPSAVAMELHQCYYVVNRLQGVPWQLWQQQSEACSTIEEFLFAKVRYQRFALHVEPRHAPYSHTQIHQSFVEHKLGKQVKSLHWQLVVLPSWQRFAHPETSSMLPK